MLFFYVSHFHINHNSAKPSYAAVKVMKRVSDGGAGAIGALIGASISSQASETERPSSRGICLLDRNSS
ncbi:uncharacterized protein ASPGLDRAFT_51019 [Aspergillus glaucus CBS 516.65]|uniref:Uncharacterized protein n=1 Tax=Aspergillus glaucus CBS 516.65 TaxID=1160497 RepID=A0A1L9VAR6_ASPGL|nr:hypothetical protein ASPGLDRAFT_51019 [Aspergillus glaucus CBS 516.65]OJJ81027.1 hypothetical protein ASPGLDRAFT_51019 [Aspergillus glaucus CBS 516.65]